MDKQAREARESIKNKPFSEKVKYFWDYYKLHTIVCIFVIVMLVSGIYSMLTAVKYDFEIVYYGTRSFTEEQVNSLKEYMSGVIEDIDGNGEKNVNFVVMSESLGKGSEQYNFAISQKFMASLAAGEYYAYIVDSNYYDQIRPDGDSGVAESAFPITDSETLTSILGEPTDREEFWCTRAVYLNEQEKPEKLALHENARRAEQALKQ